MAPTIPSQTNAGARQPGGPDASSSSLASLGRGRSRSAPRAARWCAESRPPTDWSRPGTCSPVRTSSPPPMRVPERGSRRSDLRSRTDGAARPRCQPPPPARHPGVPRQTSALTASALGRSDDDAPRGRRPKARPSRTDHLRGWRVSAVDDRRGRSLQGPDAARQRSAVSNLTWAIGVRDLHVGWLLPFVQGGCEFDLKPVAGERCFHPGSGAAASRQTRQAALGKPAHQADRRSCKCESRRVHRPGTANRRSALSDDVSSLAKSRGA
jgi:hypothetical protein